uniref:Uncharacterized protein n=1 Tax=Rhizophora mucronata TaxID=61149 RepID=A0A2P2NPW3_RHIMU
MQGFHGMLRLVQMKFLTIVFSQNSINTLVYILKLLKMIALPNCLNRRCRTHS